MICQHLYKLGTCSETHNKNPNSVRVKCSGMTYLLLMKNTTKLGNHIVGSKSRFLIYID